MDEPVDISYSIIWLIEIDILFVKTIETVSSRFRSACVTTYCVENDIATEYRRFTLADMYISIDRVLQLACSLNVRDENLLNSEWDTYQFD